MDASTLIQTIGDNGVLVVIAGVFIWTITRIINIAFKKYEERTNNKKHDKLIDQRYSISKNIQTELETTLAATKGNRIQVIEFSNSVMSVAYLPFRYMTCTYEICRLGKAATGHKIDRISTSLFTPFFEALASQPYCIFDINNEMTPVGGAMNDLMQSQDEHQALCMLLKTPKNKAIGYVQLTKDEEITQDDVDVIDDLASKLSAYLSVLDK